jgi:invasion protein IalB
MPQSEFDINIGADGMVELHVKGIKGKGCLEVVKLFEQIVGELREEQKTSEFYEPEEQVRFQIDQKY